MDLKVVSEFLPYGFFDIGSLGAEVMARENPPITNQRIPGPNIEQHVFEIVHSINKHKIKVPGSKLLCCFFGGCPKDVELGEILFEPNNRFVEQVPSFLRSSMHPSMTGRHSQPGVDSPIFDKNMFALAKNLLDRRSFPHADFGEVLCLEILDQLAEDLGLMDSSIIIHRKNLKLH